MLSACDSPGASGTVVVIEAMWVAPSLRATGMPAGSGSGPALEITAVRVSEMGHPATGSAVRRVATGAASVQVTSTVNGPAVVTFPARSSASAHRV